MIVEIKQIFMITHSLAKAPIESEDETRSFVQKMQNYIKEAATKTDSLVLFIETDFGPPRNAAGERVMNRVKVIEAELIKYARALLENRVITINPIKIGFGPTEFEKISGALLKEIKARGFTLNPKTRIRGGGAYFTWCVEESTRAFRRTAKLKGNVVRKKKDSVFHPVEEAARHWTKKRR